MNARVSDVDDAMLSGAGETNRSTGAIVSEGVVAGMCAATAVAVLFLVVDLFAGAAFRTPSQLGTLLLSFLGAAPVGADDIATPLALYTVFHFVAFIATGIVAAAIVQVAMKQPTALLLFVLLFFVFEVAFTGFVAYLDATGVTGLTPVQIALGNVVASVAMVIFFRARHPKLKQIGRAIAADNE